jgi:hypothetical protein
VMEKESEVEVKVTLWLTVSQSVCLGIEHPCGTCNQILLPVWMLLSGVLLYKNAICTSQETHYPSATEANLLMLFRGKNAVYCEVRLLFDWWSVSQYVLVSSTLVGLATRYYFLSECCCLKFVVLYLLGALSDERMGLQFVLLSLNSPESLRTRNHTLLSHLILT